MDKSLIGMASAHALKCEDDLHFYMRAAWKITETTSFVDNWHLGAMCEHLTAVSEGQIKNLSINIPPGCSKSTTVSVFWSTWNWIHRPALKMTFASYDGELSKRDSIKSRMLIESSWFQSRWGDRVKMDGSLNRMNLFGTEAGGRRFSTSVGGHITGEHPNILVVDDPHSAMSTLHRNSLKFVQNWWDLAISTRGVSAAINISKVLIMQRLHQLDLCGYIRSKEESSEWVFLVFPMRYEPNAMVTSPLGFNDPRAESGEPLLFPLMFPEDVVKSLERRLGSYGAAGQLQQRPVPLGGGLVKEEDVDANIVQEPPPDSMKIASVRSWDLASGTGADSDATASVKMIESADGFVYVVNATEGNLSPLIRDQAIEDTAGSDGQDVTITLPRDPAQAGQSQADDFVRKLRRYKVQIMPTRGSKESRLNPFASAIAAGMVKFVDGPWLNKLKFQLCQFTRADRDDMADAAGDAHRFLMQVRHAKFKAEWFRNWKKFSGELVEFSLGDVEHRSHWNEMDTIAVVRPASIETKIKENDRYTTITVWSVHKKTGAVLLRFGCNVFTNVEETVNAIQDVLKVFGTSELIIVGDEGALRFVPVARDRLVAPSGLEVNVSYSKNRDLLMDYIKFSKMAVEGRVFVPDENNNTRLAYLGELSSWSGDDKASCGFVACSVAAAIQFEEFRAWGGVLPNSGKLATKFGKGVVIE